MTRKAAIIGLGQVGSRFDEEPGRKAVWSHAGAYLALQDEFTIAGAVDPDPINTAAFRDRCPSVPIFDNHRDLLKSIDLDVVSICTPGETHTNILLDVLAVTNVRTIWLEKPAAMLVEEGRSVQERIKSLDVSVYVSHVRRWSPLWRETLRRLNNGEIGQLHHIIVKLPNRLWSIGSHAVDLALFLGKSLQSPQCVALTKLEEDGEPAVAVHGTNADGTMLSIFPTGMKNELIVEVEAIGSSGRLITDEVMGRISIQHFQSNRNYSGYMSLSKPLTHEFGSLTEQSPFVAIAQDIAKKQVPLCSYDDAVRGLELMALMAKAVGQPREVFH